MQELRTVVIPVSSLRGEGAVMKLPIGSAILRYDYRFGPSIEIWAYVLADFDQETVDVRVIGRALPDDFTGVEWSHYMGSAGPPGSEPIFLFETEGVTEEAGV